tara:strand:- start:76 stop:198 length:123 start_codon:yes stop_codon:yes gene_type:complete
MTNIKIPIAFIKINGKTEIDYDYMRIMFERELKTIAYNID